MVKMGSWSMHICDVGVWLVLLGATKGPNQNLTDAGATGRCSVISPTVNKQYRTTHRQKRHALKVEPNKTVEVQE